MAGKGFKYGKCRYRYVSRYENGHWGEGRLSEDDTITLSESSAVFQYAQTVFEGAKAFRTIDGGIALFRPYENAKRMASSCERLSMPKVSEGEFVKALSQVANANEEAIPPYGEGSLYLRPFMIGTTPVLGVQPAKEFEFRVFASPIYEHFDPKSGVELIIAEFDRAAPKGTGRVKAGLNYAMGFYPLQLAKEEGYDDCLFLDPKERRYIEEASAANVLFIDKDGNLVFPISDSILPSITHSSIAYLAKNLLHLEVEERKVGIEEAKDFRECALLGTASVVTPVHRIHYNDSDILFEQEPKTLYSLRETLLKIQCHELPAPEGWVAMVK